MTATQTTTTCYVGVNLITREVVGIAKYEDLLRDAYIVRGEFSDACDGTIFLNPELDTSYNGQMAVAIATWSREVGLGWNFQIR